MGRMKHGVPDLYTPLTIMHWQAYNRSGPALYPARPMGFQGLRLLRRLNLAWKVFAGRYDALDWGPQ